MSTIFNKFYFFFYIDTHSFQVTFITISNEDMEVKINLDFL